MWVNQENCLRHDANKFAPKMSNCSFPLPTSSPIKFNQNRTFKILQFTDLHYDTDLTIQQLNANLTLDLIAIENPDFVVFTGDMISGFKVPKTAEFKTVLKQVVQNIVSLQIPYAMVLGNHDRESIYYPSDILCLDAQEQCSWTFKSPWVNQQNQLDYILPIYPSDTKSVWDQENKNLVHTWLGLLDSGKNHCRDIKSNGCVESEQLDWFETTLNGTEQQKLVFMHQPSVEYNDVYHNYATFGSKYEAVHCSQINTGFLNTMERLKVHSVYVGHDHNNDFYGSIGNTQLVYGRKTGFGSYGPNYFPRGARVIELNENGTIKSWIRTLNGVEVQSRHDPQRLFLPCTVNPWTGMLYWLLPTVMLLGVVVTSLLIVRFRNNRQR
jgi:predicted MPP superfamily phosphohydrolase